MKYRCARYSWFVVLFAVFTTAVWAQSDPLPSWNDGPAKQAILTFVKVTTDASGRDYVPPEQRFAAFDQDGTTWVEHPLYTQVIFALQEVVKQAPKHPEWKTTEPFKTVLSGDKAAMAQFTEKDLEVIFAGSQTGMSVTDFQEMARQWIAAAKDPRWNRPYTELSISRCWRSWRICAPMAIEPTSSPVADRILCESILGRFTAFRRNR